MLKADEREKGHQPHSQGRAGQGSARTGLVAAAVAVVGRGEDGDDALLVRPLVALHDQLVRARHEQPGACVGVERQRGWGEGF